MTFQFIDFKNVLFICMYTCLPVFVYVHQVHVGPLEAREYQILEPQAVSCELPGLGAGDQTWILCETSHF